MHTSIHIQVVCIEPYVRSPLRLTVGTGLTSERVGVAADLRVDPRNVRSCRGLPPFTGFTDQRLHRKRVSARAQTLLLLVHDRSPLALSLCQYPV
jgi:hypothetical protein